MNHTGIRRNIDEVGRLVIPREIRKLLKLEQGTPMEIYIDEKSDLLLKKISPVFDLQKRAKKIIKIAHDCFNLNIMICDLEKVLTYVGENKKEFIDNDLDLKFVKLIKNRTKKYFKNQDYIEIFKDRKYSNFALEPIIIESNCYGAVIIFNDINYPYNEKILCKITNFLTEMLIF